MKHINSKSTNILTVRDSESIYYYFNDIKKYKVLSREEEQALFREYIETNNDEIFDKIIKSNLRFVITVANKYHSTNRDLLLNDLINEGNYGLIYAGKRFNPDVGVKFISFAVMYISRFILEYIYESKMVKMPYNFISVKNKIDKFITQYENLNGFQPSIYKISDELNIDERTISNIISNVKILKKGNSDEDNEVSDNKSFIENTIAYNWLEDFEKNEAYNSIVSEYVINAPYLSDEEKVDILKYYDIIEKDNKDSFIATNFAPDNIIKIINKIKKNNKIRKYDRFKLIEQI